MRLEWESDTQCLTLDASSLAEIPLVSVEQRGRAQQTHSRRGRIWRAEQGHSQLKAFEI